MAAFNISALPNPSTPLAFLPPDIAHQIEIAHYIYVGTLGAYIWDILRNLENDRKLLFMHKMSVGTAAYFFSRLVSFGYLFSGALFHTYPLNRCYLSLQVVLGFYAAALPANSLLFFLRARAIFNRNTYFIGFLAILWVSVAATAITVPIGVKGGNIGPTMYCLTASNKPYVGSSGITPVIHDTVVFLAISWRLLQNSYIDRDFKGNVRAFLTGESLPRFSQAVFRDGQVYYLITVTSNLLLVILFYDNKVAPTYSDMFTACNVMLTSVMACHVFRNAKFAYDNPIATTSDLVSRQSGAIAFRTMPPVNKSGMKNEVVLSRGEAMNITQSAVDIELDSHASTDTKTAMV